MRLAACAANGCATPPSSCVWLPDSQIRQSAGLLLKNNLKQQYAGTPPDYQEYIKVGLHQCGMLVPNGFMRRCTLPQSALAHLDLAANLRHRPQASLLLAIDHEARALRHVVGTTVATIVAVDGLGGWPQLLPALVRCLESDSVAAAEGALDALSKVVLIMHPGCCCPPAV